MRKNKHGYTLPELLVTLAIIGIVAAIVLPGLVLNSKKVTDVTSVSRGVELVQNGIKNIMAAAQDNNASGDGVTLLSALQRKDVLGEDTENPNTYMTDGDLLFSATRGLMGTEETENDYLSEVKDYSGDSTAKSIYSSFEDFTTYRFTKSGGVVVIFEPVDDSLITDDIADDAVITRVFIDANGSEKPNQFGRDIFLFGLTNSGLLVPAGSAAYNKNIFNEELDLYTETCSNEDIDNGLSCAARIMADGWNIKY